MKTKKDYLVDVLIKIQKSQHILHDLRAMCDSNDFVGMVETNIALKKAKKEINKLIIKA